MCRHLLEWVLAGAGAGQVSTKMAAEPVQVIPDAEKNLLH